MYNQEVVQFIMAYVITVVFVVLFSIVCVNLNKRFKLEKKSLEKIINEKQQEILDKQQEIYERQQELVVKNSQLDFSERNIAYLQSQLEYVNSEKTNLQSVVERLAPYEGLANIDAQIQQNLQAYEITIQEKQAEIQAEILQAKQEAKSIREKATFDCESEIKYAKQKSFAILQEAELKARNLAGEAYLLAGKEKELRATVEALRNVIDGYGNQYIKPTYSLLDELAEDFGHTDAGQMLKNARAYTQRMIVSDEAATCDYVENSRRKTAIAFVIDAFNGKVDSILSKTRKDNFGTLERKIRDAFTLVNMNGEAFRNARITDSFLNARLDELKWGVIVSELKAQALEEQRRLREQMREEEKARREYEKAMKDSAKEEEMLRKAMEKAQKEIDNATEANRAEYEAKLKELEARLVEAEEKNQRALSMAQQTKRGNVYIISNIGSFGEHVYKIGMTRRLDPMDRVRELGDASVPFPFDVHAIIESDNAPALESELHRKFTRMQLNKVNRKKEFFRVALAEIRQLVESLGLHANWTMEAAAQEYRESLKIEEEIQSSPDELREWEHYMRRE